MLTAELDDVLRAVKDEVRRRWGWTTTSDVANLPDVPLAALSGFERRRFQSVAVRLRHLNELGYLETDERDPGWWCLL